MNESLLPHWPTGQWTLECLDIERETSDVKTFHFQVKSSDDGTVPLCLHRPGQFVTLRLRHEGQLVARSYTISSTPTRPKRLALTIKRDPNGLVSRFMHDIFKVGDLLPISGPSGTFDLISVEPRDKLLMLSGGSGITPLMSMLRYIQDMRDKHFSITFIHAARTAADVLFREELEFIAARHGVKLLFICEREAEPDMAQGYLSLSLLLQHVPDIADSTVLTCGPAPFMDAVKAMLGEINFDMAHYHEESFGNPQERQNPTGATPETLHIDDIKTSVVAQTQAEAENKVNDATTDINEVTFTLSQKTVSYTSGQTLLEIAAKAGIPIATNCQMGLCGTCIAACQHGDVTMDDDEGLTEADRQAGFVLTCCGRPTGAVSIKL